MQNSVCVIGGRTYGVTLRRADAAPPDDSAKVAALKSGLAGGCSFKDYAQSVLSRAQAMDAIKQEGGTP